MSGTDAGQMGSEYSCVGNPVFKLCSQHCSCAFGLRIISGGMTELQAKSKQEEKDTSGRRLNEKITAEFVRLVTEEGMSHKVLEFRVEQIELFGYTTYTFNMFVW